MTQVMMPWSVIFSHPDQQFKPQTPKGSTAIAFASPPRSQLSLVNDEEVEG